MFLNETFKLMCSTLFKYSDNDLQCLLDFLLIMANLLPHRNSAGIFPSVYRCRRASNQLNLINCNHNHYSPSSTLLLCVHSRYNLFAHSLALHTLSHCTSYPLFYFIICFLFNSHNICIYIYSLVFFVS